jgi:hypothetical protein
MKELANKVSSGFAATGVSKARRLAGLSLVVIGAVLFVIWGFALEARSPNGSCDFEPIYYHARFLIQHQDPYIEENARYVQLKSGGYLRWNTPTPASEISIPCVYPPTALLLAAPLALLRWRSADLIWMAFLAGGIVIAAFLVWSATANDAPLLAGFLIAFTLVNSFTLLFEANAAGLAVGLSVIAFSLFLRRRFEGVGVCCLAVSLCLKPHDAGFVWLFLLLAGGILRKRAMQALLVVVVISLPAILWVSHIAPDWRQEMSTNIATISLPGGVNDPGPTSSTNQITTSAINLQTLFAVFLNKPAFYNSATYVFASIVLVFFAWAAIRNRNLGPQRWLGIAAISAFAMLPVYHRHHDARMLLLAVPGCAVLWAKGRLQGRIASFLAFLAIAVTGDIPRAILEHVEEGYTFSSTSLSGKVQMAVLTRPAPLALVIMMIFFLWQYSRPTAFNTEAGKSRELEKESNYLT